MTFWQPPRESDFTLPTDICPYPVWWSSENAYATEVEVSMFVAAFVKATQPDYIIEVGAHYGQTAERIAKVINENGHGEFVSLEIDLGLYGSAKARTIGLPVHIMLIDSLQFIPEHPVNLLFVDGAVDRLSDVRHFRPYMAPRSFILIHDMAAEGYREHIPEILEVCGQCDHIQLDTPRGLLIIKLP